MTNSGRLDFEYSRDIPVHYIGAHKCRLAEAAISAIFQRISFFWGNSFNNPKNFVMICGSQGEKRESALASGNPQIISFLVAYFSNTPLAYFILTPFY